LVHSGPAAIAEIFEAPRLEKWDTGRLLNAVCALQQALRVGEVVTGEQFDIRVWFWACLMIADWHHKDVLTATPANLGWAKASQEKQQIESICHAPFSALLLHWFSNMEDIRAVSSSFFGRQALGTCTTLKPI